MNALSAAASTTLPVAAPVFDHPWQAQAFALTVSMHRAGLFAWKDWAEQFTATIQAQPALPNEDVNAAYYRQWVATLEKMVASLKLATLTDVRHRAQAWQRAWENTPHGHAVSLSYATCAPGLPHAHTPKRTPVAVIPATKTITTQKEHPQ